MDLLEQIRDAGVVGAGGAGFPTHVKLNCMVDCLIVNAAECEPMLHTDKYIMASFSDEVLRAVESVAKLVSARESFIAVKAVNETEIKSLQAAIGRCDGGTKLFKLENYYPAGDEQLLVYDITGRVVPPGGIPLDVGIVVSNIATMLHIYDAISGKSVTHKYLTVTGKVRRPMVLRVPIGASFETCIAACGGSLIERYVIINGGPMMGKVSPGHLAGELCVTKTTSGIILLPDADNFIARQEGLPIKKILNRAKSACIQCSFCTDMCPRYLIGHKLRPHMVMRQMAAMDFSKPPESSEILREASLCCECGICETFACPMGLSPRSVNIYVKRKLPKADPGAKAEVFDPSPLRNYRKVSPKRIMYRMGLGEFYGIKPHGFMEISADTVSIPVKQHIGAPARPVVFPNDPVTVGQLIARGEDGKVSAHVHASISGRVVRADEIIIIKGGAE